MKENSVGSSRLFLDCTYIYKNDPESGIQRVVRNILNESKNLRLGNKYKIIYVIWVNGAFYEVNWPPSGAVTQTNYTSMVLKISSCLRLMLPSAIYSILRKIYIAIRPTLKTLLQPATPKGVAQEKVYFTKRDTLVLLDSSWHVPYWREVAQARKNGAKVGMVAYDLIPIRYPQFCDAGVIESFTSWLNKALYWSNFCLTISEATAKDLKEYSESAGFTKIRSKKLAIKSFKLGADLDKSNKEMPRQRIQDFVNSSEHLYVSVGTLEPRKNQRFLVDVFDGLWEQGSVAKLCLAGRKGWHTESFIKYIQAHPQYGDKLCWFSDLNDGELQLIYKNAKALIIPSIQEGFGLPIIEALSHQRPVFASDIPVFREVGKSYCTYFSLTDPQDLADKLSRHIEGKYKTPGLGRHLSWPTWRVSTREFIYKAIQLAS